MVESKPGQTRSMLSQLVRTQLVQYRSARMQSAQCRWVGAPMRQQRP